MSTSQKGKGSVPRVLGITFPEGANVSEDLMWWLRQCVYPQKPDTTSPAYGRSTNPLVVTAEEAELLEKYLEAYYSPFIFLSRDIPAKMLPTLLALVQKAIREYYGSFGLSPDVAWVENPQENAKLQQVLFRRIGGMDWIIPNIPECERLSGYFAQFCGGAPKILAKLAYTCLWLSAQNADLRGQLPGD